MDFRRILGIVAVIVGSIAGRMVARAAFKPDMKSARFLSRVADETNRKLPMMVDSETRLVKTTGSQSLFTYQYTMVNIGSSDIDAGRLSAALEPEIAGKACADSSMREILNSGVTLRYSYDDKYGTHVADVDITAGDCH
jgi:hypothetical protein